MNVPTTIDAAAWLGKYLEGADGDQDLARAMIAAFAEALMSAQASMQCNAAYGERTDERENSRNGYRMRPWDTRVGSVDLVGPEAPPRASTARSSCSSHDVVPRRPWWRWYARPTWKACPPAGSTTWSRPWASRGSPSPRCPGWPKSSTPRWPSSGNGPSMAVPTATCGSTPSPSGCVREAGWSTCRR